MGKRKKTKKKEIIIKFYEEKHYLIEIENCPRCEGYHKYLTLYEIRGNPIFKQNKCYDSWAICPETKSPILIGYNKNTKKRKFKMFVKTERSPNVREKR